MKTIEKLTRCLVAMFGALVVTTINTFGTDSAIQTPASPAQSAAPAAMVNALDTNKEREYRPRGARAQGGALCQLRREQLAIVLKIEGKACALGAHASTSTSLRRCAHSEQPWTSSLYTATPFGLVVNMKPISTVVSLSQRNECSGWRNFVKPMGKNEAGIVQGT